MNDFIARLTSAAAGAGIALGREEAEKFYLLYLMLSDSGKKMNLTAICDEDGVIMRHFVDCLTVVPFVDGCGKRVVDIGCGGGFPTLPLAIVRPGLEITAVDSTAKKLTFVDEVSKKLSLNVKTVAARAEELGAGRMRESFDVALSRAVARMNVLCELCMPLVRVGGSFIAMKGADGHAEIVEAENAIRTLGGELVCEKSFELPGAGGRVIAVIRKKNGTPPNYPRQYAKIKSRPL